MVSGPVIKGMTKKDVMAKLGPPSGKTTDREYRRQYTGGVVSLGGGFSLRGMFGRGGEYWFYSGVPGEKYDTIVCFRGRRVVEVVKSPAR